MAVDRVSVDDAGETKMQWKKKQTSDTFGGDCEGEHSKTKNKM